MTPLSCRINDPMHHDHQLPLQQAVVLQQHLDELPLVYENSQWQSLDLLHLGWCDLVLW